MGVSDWPGWVAWYVAEEKGFFKKHGADVELVWFPNYTDSISALSAGHRRPAEAASERKI